MVGKIHINKIVIEMSTIYAKLINHFKFKNQLTFLVLFIKYGEDNELLSEIELPITIFITHNLTQSEFDKIKIQWTLEIRI